MGLLQDKVVLITGGESGIGRASARLFVSEGAYVHLVGLDKHELAEAVNEFGSDRAFASVTDVSDETAVIEAVREGIERFGHYNVLFSNAGISGAAAKITEYPSDVFERVLKIHVLGAFYVLKHAAPYLEDGGSVIITSSGAGLIGAPDLSAYVTAKHAQVGLMRSAAKEFAARKIRVNTLHPGPTSTPFQDDIEMRSTGMDQKNAAQAFDDTIPLGRHSTPEEIAHAALYLASDVSAMVTASTFKIDGGLTG
ncbi:SDR family NAD(P)-dependent oxidoreductase [Rhodococcus koreensis]